MSTLFVPHPTLQGIAVRIVRGYAKEQGLCGSVVGCDSTDNSIIQVAIPLGIMIKMGLISRTPGNRRSNLVCVQDSDVAIVCDSVVSKENIKAIKEII